MLLVALLLALLLPAQQWTAPPVLDQGRTPYCVGYAWEGFLLAGPAPQADAPDGTAIFRAATQLDGIWPRGENDGTFTWAGAEALQRQGRLGGYTTTRSLVLAAFWLSYRGPIIMEGPFPKSEHWQLNAHGELVWYPDTRRHAWTCYGRETNGDLDCVQSWGPAYGYFKLDLGTAQHMISTNGLIYLPWKP